MHSFLNYPVLQDRTLNWAVLAVWCENVGENLTAMLMLDFKTFCFYIEIYESNIFLQYSNIEEIIMSMLVLICVLHKPKTS